MYEFHFVTFSDKNYANQQNKLCLYAEELEQFKSVNKYSKEKHLLNSEFYKENKNILDQSRGCGYWLWKPYFILEKLNEIDYGEVVFYLDCADVFYPNLVPFLKNNNFESDVILVRGAHPNRDWTKRDCFVYMMCDEEKYWNHNQLEAGIGFYKKTPKTMKVVREWLEFCKNPNILTDVPNISNLPNFDNFQDHRHDQSVLTNIAVKHDLRIENEMIRQFVACNVNEN